MEGMGYALFTLIAVSMLSVMLYAVYEMERWRSPRRVAVALYLTGMMLTMNLGAYIYVAFHDAFYVLALNGAYMFFGLLVLLNVNEVKKGWGTYLVFSLLLVSSEVFMGSLFYSMTTGRPATFDSSVDSPWFVGVMLPEMVFALALAFKRSDKHLRRILLAVLALMPWFPLVMPVDVAFWGSSAVMIGATVLVYDTLYEQRLKSSQEVFTVLELMGAFTAMMAGAFLFFLTGDLTLYNASMLTTMAWFVYRTLGGPNGRRGNYLRDPKVAFAVIFLTFVMEFFMGGVLDFVEGVFSPGVNGFTSSLALPWESPTSPLNVLWDGVDVVGSVLGSVWFLVMMGVEMGFLAFKKMMEVKVREVKVRIGLMILAYFVYTVYLASFSPISSVSMYIPYMWSMGIGTLGPVSNAVLVGLMGTYAIYGALSFFFGSRNLCAVTCSAPMMYQGSFYDSLKVYNRTSRLARKRVTSRTGPAFRAVALGVSLLVLALAVVSYLNSEGVLRFTVAGVDVTMLLYFLWFDVLWYALFVSIPFVGTFACVTSGYCYWGVFNQAVSRVGLFRLKVRNPEVCLHCQTVDCANACPVGITDMRGSFIRKGEFKAMKCVGIGECVDACPHHNVFFYDVRHWVRERFSRIK